MPVVDTSGREVRWVSVLEWGAGWLLALVALVPVFAVVRVFAARLHYPLDLEWCEGGSAYMAWRLLHHLPVYTKPGDVFAPFPYPPGHTLALALAGWLAGGLDYGPARAVSVLSFAVLCATLFVAVRRPFPGRWNGSVAGLAAVAFVACTFPCRRRVVRPDSGRLDDGGLLRARGGDTGGAAALCEARRLDQ
ncbi:MAG: hypothetical protein U0Q55_21420 [Vicinamibacterales bacterium]